MRATVMRPSSGMRWKQGNFPMGWGAGGGGGFGASRPKSTFPSTAAEVSRLPDISMGNRGRLRSGMWHSTPRAGRRSAGAKDQKVGWSRGFLLCGCNPHTGSWLVNPRKEVWLLVQWPEEEKEPTRYFLCDLPPSTTLRRLVVGDHLKT